MIRAGKNGKYANKFLSSSIIAMENYDLGPLAQDVSKDEFINRYIALHPTNTKIQARNTITQLDRFIHSIAISDNVLTYEPNQRVYYIGIVKSAAIWGPSIIPKLPCVRNVKWDREVYRDNLDHKFISSLGSLLSVFKVKPEVTENIMINAKPLT